MSERTSTVSRTTYVVIWAALMALLLLTWGMAQFDFGAGNTIVAMLIAVVKMSLVMLIFMHVRYNSSLTWVFAGAGFLWLAIMVSFTLSDYLTRGTIRQNGVISFYAESPPNHPPEQGPLAPHGGSR